MTDREHMPDAEKESDKHAHLYEHEADLHEHEHAHAGLSHSHPHYHEPIEHEHPHEHEAERVHDHARIQDHVHLTEHVHLHAYSFERYAEVKSRIHSVDPRLKLVLFMALIVTIVLTPPLPMSVFLAYAAMVAALIYFSRLPWIFVLKRSMIVIPFVLFVVVFAPFTKRSGDFGVYDLGLLKVYVSGLIIVWNAFIKAWLSVVLMITLTATTRFADLLNGLAWLKVPAVIVSMLSFIYRFAFVSTYHLGSMVQALRARGFNGRKLWQWRILSQLLGGLFIRSYEHGERLYDAMQARCFSGEIRFAKHGSLSITDLAFSVFFLAAYFSILVWRSVL